MFQAFKGKYDYINVYMGEILAKKWKHEMKNKKQKIF